MMDLGYIDTGKEISMLRKIRGMTRVELAEAAGISDSHLKKIESGTRQPGMGTYQKIMQILGAGMVVMDNGQTLKGSCVAKVQEILLDSTEDQAVFMTSVMEAMARNIGMIAQQ